MSDGEPGSTGKSRRSGNHIPDAGFMERSLWEDVMMSH